MLLYINACEDEHILINKKVQILINGRFLFFIQLRIIEKKQTTLYAYLTEEKKKRVHKEKEEYAQV